MRGFSAFLRDERGVAMTEAIVAVPFLTLLAAGILEFGSVFWQREQIQTGLRDAARYMARCRHAAATCEANARNLAYYGSTAAGTAHRVPDWNATNSNITFTIDDTGPYDAISAATTHQILHSPIFGLLGIDEITVTSNHDQRVIGW